MTQIHIIEKNFDSGFRGYYKGYHIDTRLIVKPQMVSPIYNKIMTYATSNILNPIIIALQTFDSIVFFNEQIEKIYIRHSKKDVIRNICEITNEKENVIHIMKRIIDDFIMILCAFYDAKNISQTCKIEIASIGELKNNNTTLSTKIKNDLNYEKYDLLFNIINDLHNAYKHSCLMPEAHLIFAKEGVSLNAYYARYNKINKFEYHNHNFIHIIVGFSDFLLEFCGVETYDRTCKINISERDLSIQN